MSTTSPRTILSLQRDAVGVFDGTFQAKGLRSGGGPAAPALGDEVAAPDALGRGGFVEIPRDPLYDGLDSFTISATVTLRKSSERQTILQGEHPPLVLYVEPDGKLAGSVHTASGWRTATSGRTPVPTGRPAQVTFSRDGDGVLRLSLDGQQVGTRKAPGPLAAVGDEGLVVGIGIDRRSAALRGELTSLTLQNGVVSAAAVEQRVKRADLLRSSLQQALSLSKIRVIASQDESYARLQPIKSILSAVGVDRLSDLTTLRVPSGTVLVPGKVMVAGRASVVSPIDIDWSSVAVALRAANASGTRNLLAQHVPNRNSEATIVSALKAEPVVPVEATSPAVSAVGPVTTPGGVITASSASAASAAAVRPIAVAAASSLRSVAALRRQADTADDVGDRAAAVLAASHLASATNLSQVIDLESETLRVRDPDLVPLLLSDQPQDWPMVEGVKMFTATTTVLPFGSSVMIGNKVDLRGVQLLIQPEVLKLYIIAEELLVDTASTITWRRPGGWTPGRADDPDLNGRSFQGQHLKPDSYDGVDGDDGRPGGPGLPGATGRHAPALEIWARAMNGMPNLDLNGEDGIRGGQGQRGGRGGDGADGRAGQRMWFLGWHCTTDPGDGGDGGNGGDGGRGGRGGSGGHGGDITVGVLDGTIETTVTANLFRVKNQGGQLGRGGDGGAGGDGGWGGRSGVGETCTDAENGHVGARGQPGRTGDDGAGLGSDGYLDFFEFSEDAWEELLTRPWLTELVPGYVFPGDRLTLSGSRFTPSDRVHVGTSVLAPTVNPDESLSVAMPTSIAGGEQVVFVSRPDGTESNRLRLWVKPALDPVSAVIAPGATVNVTGRAFLDGASVTVDGVGIPAQFVSATALRFDVPGTGGTGSSEHSVQVRVRNPDGMLSNIRTTTVPRILEIPFRFDQHALSFDNFTDGAPSWGTYEDTYGAAEIYHELFDPIFGHPVLTAAFYAFYDYFLKGETNGGLATGFCTSMTARVLDELWTGSTDTLARVSLDAATRRQLTAIHGRLLSRESLIHFHDQGRQGVGRVLQTYREIEQTFRNGCDRHNAPMLFFIPSGAVWDAGYIDGLGSSHCIAPVRFVYPPGHPGPAPDGTTDPDGVTLFCWDCNHPPPDDSAAIESENCRMVFKRVDGQIHFDYFDGGSQVKFSSENGITLGMMTNGAYLLSDHDLPFSGPFGLTRFVLDFLLSPADLQVADQNGMRTGRYGSQILAEIPGSHPCYLMKGAYLLPSDAALTRSMVGEGVGTYAFHSIAPGGTSLSLEGVATAPGQVDRLAVSADGTQVRFTPGTAAPFSLQLAREAGGQVRAVSISGIGGAPADDIDVTISPELSVIRVGNRSADRTVDVSAMAVQTATQAHATADREGVTLPQSHDLVVTVSDWADLDLDVQVVHF